MELNIFKRNKILCIVLLNFLIVAAAAQEPDINGYTADKPLLTFSHDTIRGGLTFTTGDSYYSEKVWTGDIYTVHEQVSLPEGAEVEFARLYNYWTWSAKGSTGMYPDMKLTFNGIEIETDEQYSDRKGWGIYDYPTGTWSYDVTDYITKSDSYTVVIENTGPDGSFFCINGVGLLVVYSDEQGNYMEYWVNEGCDMLNSGLEDDSTSTFTMPDQTVTEMMTPTISQGQVKKATLWTVVQSGNWEANRLWVNDMNWSGICDATPYPDLDVDIRDITEHLTDGKNTIRFQAVEDYAVPSGSFLVVEKEPPAGGAPISGSQDLPSSGESGSKGTPGFGVIPAIVLVTVISVLTSWKGKRGKKTDR